MAENIMTAEDKAYEMMHTPIKDLPERAVAHMRFLGGKYGMCMEICMNAYLNYAYKVLELPLEDEEGLEHMIDLDWFDNN